MDDNVFSAFSFQSVGFSRSPLNRLLGKHHDDNVGRTNIPAVAHHSSRSYLPQSNASREAPETVKFEALATVKSKLEDAHMMAPATVKLEALATVKSELEDAHMIAPSQSQLSGTGPLRSKRTVGRQLEASQQDHSSTKIEVEIEDYGEVFHGKKVTESSLVKTVCDQDGPANWRTIIDGIRCMRADRDAPVDHMGTHQLADEAADTPTQRFHLLVAAMISSQTRDLVTAAAMGRLHALSGGLNIHGLCNKELTVDNLAEILKPVGFYRQKAKYLKVIAEKLAAPPYNGCIPDTLDELLKLPGVGPKVALLVLWVAFGKGEEGLIVDTNVRRVCCRLGWAPTGSNPEQTRAALEKWLPKSLWPEISFLFVGFGQQVCKPVNPQCITCKVKDMCPNASHDMQRQIPKKKKTKNK